ncbi:S-adenosyl-L-methionine-dependent methyltransferase [Hygrophoropsis aurantiaca]|uniref:S-adenosyl-L-methionine-dependent methyltransferase n=1 Tax=Hygrophoropsis aurantiaca TaxID=72124 RepID=A0ACB7ZQ41_9AGAM|nr:S-adenosyl-L-methionine-dependent methyltransferase [Hygrophoropsis aurantiaca]
MSEKAKLKALLELITTSTEQAIAEYEKDGGNVPSLASSDSHPLDSATDSLALKKAIRTLEGACQQLCATLAPPQHTVVNLVEHYDWACIRVVIEAKIADILVEHPNGIHVDQLSRLVNMNASKLARVLRPLASKGCFREVTPDVFANNRLSLVLRSTTDVCGIARIHASMIYKGATVLYENLTEAEYASSVAPDKAPLIHAFKGQITGSFFDLLKSDDSMFESYHRGMIGVGSIMGSLSVLEHFPWDNYSSVCDVGGGIGTFSFPLAKRYPHLKVTCHDLPEVILQGQAALSKEYPGVNNVQLIPFNFFEQTPLKGQDVYYLRHVIHDWHDEEATLILRNVRKSMPPHSRLLIQDYVVQSSASLSNGNVIATDKAPYPMLPNFGAGNARLYQGDLTMFFVHNARERTLNEFIEIGNSTGFQLQKVWDLAESCVMEYSPI